MTKEISVEAMGFDFTMVSPNMVHLDQDKLRGLAVGDEVHIYSKREGNVYTFKITKLYFNGFEYEV